MRKNISFARRISRKLSGRQNELIARYVPFSSKGINNAENFLDSVTTNNHFNNTVLEIGFGNGEHTFTYAQQNPDTCYIGCEPYLNGVVSLLNKIDQKKLNNIKVWSEDVHLLLTATKKHFFDKVMILYPDPWPKKRHYKRRIINQHLLAILIQKIKPTGQLIITTDHQDYATWILQHLMEKNFFENTNKYSIENFKKFPENWFKTKYQKRAEKLGNISYYFECKMPC